MHSGFTMIPVRSSCNRYYLYKALYERSCSSPFVQHFRTTILRKFHYNFYCFFTDSLLIVNDVEIALRKQQGGSNYSFRRAFENNYFGKVSLINLVSTWSNLPKHCVFSDYFLIVSHAQGVLLKIFFSFILVPNK